MAPRVGTTEVESGRASPRASSRSSSRASAHSTSSSRRGRRRDERLVPIIQRELEKFAEIQSKELTPILMRLIRGQEEFRKVQNEMRREFNTLQQNQDEMRQEFNTLQQNQDEMRQEFNTLHRSQDEMRRELNTFQGMVQHELKENKKEIKQGYEHIATSITVQLSTIEAKVQNGLVCRPYDLLRPLPSVEYNKKYRLPRTALEFWRLQMPRYHSHLISLCEAHGVDDWQAWPEIARYGDHNSIIETIIRDVDSTAPSCHSDISDAVRDHPALAIEALAHSLGLRWSEIRGIIGANDERRTDSERFRPSPKHTMFLDSNKHMLESWSDERVPKRRIALPIESDLGSLVSDTTESKTSQAGLPLRSREVSKISESPVCLSGSSPSIHSGGIAYTEDSDSVSSAETTGSSDDVVDST